MELFFSVNSIGVKVMSTADFFLDSMVTGQMPRADALAP